MNWMRCMEEALSYIEDHLDGEIDERVVSQKAGCSIYNFQRVFSFLMGTSLADYIRARRLTLAGEALRSTDGRILDIALKYGYESQEAFSRAFQKFHGVSPSAARHMAALPAARSRATVKILFDNGDASKNMNINSHMLSRVRPDNVFYKGVKGPGTLLFSVCLWSWFEFLGQNHDPARTYTILASLSGDAYRAGISLPTSLGIIRALDALNFRHQVFTTDPAKANYIDETEAKRKIVQSISCDQRPALVCSQTQVCFGGAIIGYEDDGDTLVNWGYFPFDDRDRPEPILTPWKDWYRRATHIILPGERVPAPELKELYITGVKGAYEDLWDGAGLRNEDFYAQWKRFLRLNREGAIQEVRRSRRVPGTWEPLPEDANDEESILGKIREIIDPLWCDFAERKFYAAHFLRQAKEFAPDAAQQGLERASAAFFRVHELMYAYIQLVGLQPGSDAIDMDRFFDPAVQQKFCEVIDQCRARETEVIEELSLVIPLL